MKILGTNDAVNSCDCCGKTNLKATVIVELTSGEIAHYGSVCATRHTGKKSSEIKNEIEAAYRGRLIAAAREFNMSAENAALEVAYAAAHREKLIGKAFREATRQVSDAASIRKNEIAAKFNVPAHSF